MLNYRDLNFKCGIELHAQLETSKLFCRCPTLIDNNEPDLTIKRKLRAVAGEAGKKDIAALYEESQNKTFIYEYSDKYACLMCLDEEPANKLNKEALKIALEISILLNAKIKPELKILRKTIVDGSNISGFQRTALIATNGKIKTSKGLVNIPTIFLEEDAARRIKTVDNHITFRLDRLGTPLIEIATSPDIKDPEHAKETAELLGMVLKSTGKTKAEIGTKRQDINLSINNGARIELKGFQNLKLMPHVIEKEIKRQLDLINEGKSIKEEVRRVNPDTTTTFLRPLPGKARMYLETDVPNVKITKPLIKSISLSELLTEKTVKLEQEHNLSPELAKEIIKQKLHIEPLIKKYQKLSPKFIAQILIEIPKELKSRYNINYEYSIKEFDKILEYVNEHNLSKEAILDIMQKISKKHKINLDDYKQIDVVKLKEEIKNIFEKDPNLSPNAIMGLIMKKYGKKVNPKSVFELIKQIV